MSEKMARSSRVFLLGLVFACGVEVLVDWNQTLTEINVLRNGIRQKGEGYVSILSKASDDELKAKDASGLERLSQGVFDDDDAVYVRFTDASGVVVWDKEKPGYAEIFQKRGFGVSFTEHYAALMKRDTTGILQSPGVFKARVAGSRYRDFAQIWTDTTAKLVARFSAPKPPANGRGSIVYQDRLRDENHVKDDAVSYAIGTVLSDDARDIGTVIVAFDMKRTNDAVRIKYLKFVGLVVFFVALILVQNTVSRRNKLRLLDLEERYGAAKKALREAMPKKNVRASTLSANGHVEQAKGSVDGMVWSAADEGDSLIAMMIDPDGDGIDAAAVGLHVARTFMARRMDPIKASLEEEMRALGEAANAIPLTRPIGTLLIRVDRATGNYDLLAGSFAVIQILTGNQASSVELVPMNEEAPEGVVGPIFKGSGNLPLNASLVGICSSAQNPKDARVFVSGVSKYLARTQEVDVDVPVEDATIWARGRNAALNENDIAILAVTRGTTSKA